MMAKSTNPQPNPDEIRDLLSAYLDDEVNAAERERVEQAVTRSPELQEELETLRQTVALVSALPSMPAPRPFTLTEADIGQAPAASPKKSVWFSWPAWAGGLAALVSALVCVLAAGGLLFGTQFGGGSMAPAEIALQQESAAPESTQSERMQLAADEAVEEAPAAAQAPPPEEADTAAVESLEMPAEQPEALTAPPPEEAGAAAVESQEMPAEASAPAEALTAPPPEEAGAAAAESSMPAEQPAEEEMQLKAGAAETTVEGEAAEIETESAGEAREETALMAVPESADAAENQVERAAAPSATPSPLATAADEMAAAEAAPPAEEMEADTAAASEAAPVAPPVAQATPTAAAAPTVTHTPVPLLPPAPVATTPPAPTPAASIFQNVSVWMIGLMLAALVMVGVVFWMALRGKKS